MTAQARHFLDIRKSATGRSWQERLSPAETNIATDIAQTHGVADVLARILAARGIARDAVETHLNPTLRAAMPDPATVTDLQSGAARIAKAVEARQRVAIFGDYDVDGAASSALLHRYLAHFGMDAQIYIPDRIFEGYGPNAQAIEALARDHDLIVAVDCGTNSAEPLSVAVEHDCDVVVLDHHQVGGALPAVVAVVNPNREDDLSGLGHLCAAGVVFLTLVDVSRQLRTAGTVELPDLLSLLDLVALATVCDVVALTGLNRAFVRQGLVVARRQGNAGLTALARVARLSGPLAAHHFGFMIGPRINAGGRIGNAALGAKLLTLNDEAEAQAIAQELDRLNAERQAIEASMVAEAKASAEMELASSSPPGVLVLANEGWHPGIAGLIASRVKDAFHRPSFAIALEGTGKGTGSARSIPGLDVGRLVRDAVAEGHLIKGGGHAMAAGVTVEAAKLGALRAFFEERVGGDVQKLVEMRSMKIDAALSARGVNHELLDLLEQAGPFGTGYATPVFVLPNHRIEDVRLVGTNHLRVRLASNDGARIDAMAFGASETELGGFLRNQIGAGPVHIAGTVSPNTWRGETRPQFRIIDAAEPAG